jgi:cysteine-rich repeat protein
LRSMRRAHGIRLSPTAPVKVCLLSGLSFDSHLVTCGDGIVVSPETCDTKGVTDPGCVNCNITLGYQCFYSSPLQRSVCSSMSSWSALLFVWPIAHCGDGLIVGSETCDDSVAHHLTSTGCSDACTIEVGWNCSGQPSNCSSMFCYFNLIYSYSKQFVAMA